MEAGSACTARCCRSAISADKDQPLPSQVFTDLKAKRIRTMTTKEAAAAAAAPTFPFARKTVLLDVREAEKFANGHAYGAINVPLYTVMEAPADSFDTLRAAYFSLFGMKVPMRNDKFAQGVAAAVGGRRDTALLVMCQSGGTLETTEERKKRDARLPAPVYGEFGAASRSLMAIHELVTEGKFTNVAHVAGGYSQWRADGLQTDVVDDEEE